jgi:CheY-like chemotaxis protein
MAREIRVLVVEDSESKGNSIQSVIERSVPFVLVQRAYSVKSALQAVVSFKPDFVIADMSLPTFDIEPRERGGSPRPFGGIEVFETLERYEIEVPVLVVTAYEALSDGESTISLSELSNRLESEFPDCFVGAVYFDTTFSSWERDLEFHLTSILAKIDGT